MKNNKTYNYIIDQLKSVHSWENSKNHLDNIVLIKTPSGNYGVMCGGFFTGVFVVKDFIDMNELKGTNIKIQ
jgi:hypothetical protein